MVLARSVSEALDAHNDGAEFVLFNGDCAELVAAMASESVALQLTSPPYFMGKSYDRSYDVEDFYADMRELSDHVVRVLRSGGNMCWQVGYHVGEQVVLPLDFAVYEVYRDHPAMRLRNRIIWHFGHGTHAKKRFSGRHETVLWYCKGVDGYFDLDAVRVEQKYPGKRHYKGPNRGQLSGNPLGKNPADVWDIPNVKANHVEKTDHPCQFPIALAQRLVRALAPIGGLVLDPFAGSCTTGIAACMDGRRFIGAETSLEFCEIGIARYRQLKENMLKYRPVEKPIWAPGKNDAVARKPEHFASF